MPTHGPHDETRRDYQSPELLAFVRERLAVEDQHHARVLAEMRAQGLPPINIGPMEGRLLEFLVRSCGAKKAVEIGTLGGYSAMWIARALPPHGRLYTLEAEPKHAAVAEASLAEAGLSRIVSVMVGDAAESLKKLEKLGPFDFCFIDADKTGYPKYLRWAAKNLRSGGIVAADNAFLFGKVHLKPEDAGDDAAAVRAMRDFLHHLADESEFVSCAMIPTGEGLAVGIKK